MGPKVSVALSKVRVTDNYMFKFWCNRLLAYNIALIVSVPISIVVVQDFGSINLVGRAVCILVDSAL